MTSHSAALEASTADKLEPFLLLAKSLKGAACAQLILDTLNAPDVFVFAELLDLPSIRDVKQTGVEYAWIRYTNVSSYQAID